MSTQEQPRGIVGTIKEKLGLAVPEETSAEQVVKEKIAAPTTPGREGPVCAPDQSSMEEWKKAEADTVRAEREAKRAQQIVCEADTVVAEAESATKLKRRLNRFFGGLCRQQVTRQAEELRAQEERLKQAAAARDKEAAELERQLAEARRAAAEADKRREEILKESYAQQQPAKELAAEADRLAKEAAHQRQLAMDLAYRAERLATGKPVAEAMKKEEAAEHMKQEMQQLQHEAQGELADAERKRREADKASKAAADKVREADEIAKKYWAVRDESKRLEALARDLMAEAGEEERDAEKKKVTVERLEKRAEQATAQAQDALRRKAQLEKQADDLRKEQEAADSRAAQLESEAESRRKAAEERQRAAMSKREQADQVVAQVPVAPDDAAKRAAEARKAADQARQRLEAVEAELNHLQDVARKSEHAAKTRAEAARGATEEAEAAQKRQAELWESAKQHGDRARELSSEEAKRRMEAMEGMKQGATATAKVETDTTETTMKASVEQRGGPAAFGDKGKQSTTGEHSSSYTKTTKEEREGGVPEALKYIEQKDIVKPSNDRPAHVGATDVKETVPSKPEGTKAGDVDLPVKEGDEEYRRQEEEKMESAVKM